MLETAVDRDVVKTEQSKNYGGIDLTKFICAIMVLMVHISPLPESAFEAAKYVNFGLQKYICRLAVPFFFVSSGYFLFRKMERHELNTDRIKAYIFKILRLIGTWSVLLVVGGTGHLWYLGATIVAIVLLSLCLCFRLKLRYIYLIAAGLYMIGLLGDAYKGFLAPLENITVFKYLFLTYAHFFYSTRNGLFMGFIFVLMGASFAWYDINMKRVAAWVGFAVSMICLFAEVFALKYHDIPSEYNMYIFLLPAVFFLFYLARGSKLRERAIYRHLRTIGVLIYFLHMLVSNTVTLGLHVADRLFGVVAVQYHFSVTLLATVALAVLIEWLSHKEKFRWLQWLYS